MDRGIRKQTHIYLSHHPKTHTYRAIIQPNDHYALWQSISNNGARAWYVVVYWKSKKVNEEWFKPVWPRCAVDTEACARRRFVLSHGTINAWPAGYQLRKETYQSIFLGPPTLMFRFQTQNSKLLWHRLWLLSTEAQPPNPRLRGFHMCSTFVYTSSHRNVWFQHVGNLQLPTCWIF